MMTEDEALLVLAEQYRKEGYDVALPPLGQDLPPFLRTDADLVATKGDEVVAVQVKRHEPASERPYVLMSGRIDDSYSLSLASEAERLVMPETLRSALVMSWSAFEAAAREVLRGFGRSVEKRNPSDLLQELLNRKLIDELDYERLRQCMYLRNLVVHGVRPDNLPQDLVPFMLATVRKLKNNFHSDNIRLGGEVSFTIFRGSINRKPEFRKIVERATDVLNQVLGRSRGLVSVEWDEAEDSRGRQVILLKLADFTGEVTATFSPDELENPNHLRTRFYRIWGDLLQIRTARQLESIVGKEGA